MKNMDNLLTGLQILITLTIIPVVIYSFYLRVQRRKLLEEGAGGQETPAPVQVIQAPPPAPPTIQYQPPQPEPEPEKVLALNGVTVDADSGHPVKRWTDIHVKIAVLMVRFPEASARDIQETLYGKQGGRKGQEVAQMIRELKSEIGIDAVPSVPASPRSAVPSSMEQKKSDRGEGEKGRGENA